MAIEIDQGAAAEYAFASQLLSRGIVPCWPSVESKPYDFIADTGKQRYKIQVKSTAKTTATIDVQFMMSAGPKRRRYSKNEVDFIVLFVIHFDVWYIIPIDDVETGIRIRPGDPKCKYRIYQDAWHLFEERKD